MIKSLALSATKGNEAQELAKKIVGKLNGKGSQVEKTAIKTRLENILVEWGMPVPARTVTKNPDHAAIAELLAAVAAASE